MLFLMICSFVGGVVIIIRALALRRSAVMPEIVGRAIDELQPGDEPDRLRNLVRGDPSSLGRIAATGLNHLRWSKNENSEAVQTRARHEIVRMEKGLVILEVIVGIAPLLGLLGTVSGLVRVFASLGAETGMADPRGIALGISEALNTTIVGLAIAVPTLIAFSYFSKKIETMTVEMESMAADLLAKCYEEPKPRSRTQLPPRRETGEGENSEPTLPLGAGDETPSGRPT